MIFNSSYLFVDGCRSFAPNAQELAVVVEFYTGSVGYYICADNFTGSDADVICRENSNTSHSSYYNVSKSDISNNNTYQIYPYAFNCNGTESILCNCSTQHSICTTDSVIAVACNIEGMCVRKWNVSI